MSNSGATSILQSIPQLSTSFAALYFVGGVRVTFSTGIATGGNLAYWTSFIISCVFTFIIAAVIAEICSSLSLAGSIYLWAVFALVDCLTLWSRGGAQRLGLPSVRVCNTQGAVNYLLSVRVAILSPLYNSDLFQEIVVFNIDFPSDSSDVKFRALQWITTEIMLALAAIWNLLPQIARYFKWIFYLSTSFGVLDFLLNIIWLPIATARTIGFSSPHDAFMMTYNATAGILIGLAASGHVAEETKNAAVTAARGIFWSTILSGIGGFVVVIIFLFCVPDADTFFSFGGPQPFVPLCAVILGDGGHIFMNIICIVALWFNTAIAVLGISALITCTILSSAIAFTSLVSAAGVPSAVAYGLICLGRLFCTPKTFPNPAWCLGRLSKPFQTIAVLWNAWVVAILYSPYVWPVEADTLNYAPVIMAATTILALISWWVPPAERWLPNQRIQETLEARGAGGLAEEVH
ncbi:hypothetical protein EAF00_009894 [Botryotinia globosa]|nr:hypothetical protein EAF00_009894 [Botryotinia globosa]